MTNFDPSDWRARRAALQAFLASNFSAAGTADLRALGFSPKAIDRLRTGGWIHRRCRGVYVGAGGPQTLETDLRCALLRSGPTSSLTRRSAAHFLGHLRFPAAVPQVLVPGDSGFLEDPELERHGATDLEPGDIIVHRGLRTTSPYRTILHLAADASEKTGRQRDASERVLRWALRSMSNADHGLVGRLRAKLDHAPFAGSAVLRAQIGADLQKTAVIRSSVEDRFVELCKRYGIPVPETNVVVHGIELDVYWREHGAYLELDTFETHGGEISFERDRADAGVLGRHGLRGFPVTDRRIDHEADDVAADVLGLLGLLTASSSLSAA